MSATKIDWADAVWNPITGCSKVSPACDHCWAERMSKRLAGRCGYPAADPFAVAFHPDRLEEPLRWRKPRRVFVCSMGDLFHEDVTDDQLLAVFTTMAQPQARHHTFLILTKRPDRMREWFDDARRAGLTLREGHGAVLPNVWLGVTAENQAMADERIPALLDTPAARHFVSCEPLLGPVALSGTYHDYLAGQDVVPEHASSCDGSCSNGQCPVPVEVETPPLDWVIVGGETGPGARPTHPAWVRAIRDDCQDAGVPFFFKQWGEWAPQDYAGCLKITGLHPNREIIQHAVEGPGPGIERGPVNMRRVGKKAAGHRLDGREWREVPGS